MAENEIKFVKHNLPSDRRRFVRFCERGLRPRETGIKRANLFFFFFFLSFFIPRSHPLHAGVISVTWTHCPDRTGGTFTCTYTYHVASHACVHEDDTRKKPSGHNAFVRHGLRARRRKSETRLDRGAPTGPSKKRMKNA